ncbi:MAG: hypothetical protein QOH15_2690, partial [Gaiellales bacterium]|nr:hypothetical protein [Gaiellales bacterium]
MRGFARERGLALVALLLALVGLVASASGSDAPTTRVIVAARSVTARAIIGKDMVHVVAIAARDRTPG